MITSESYGTTPDGVELSERARDVLRANASGSPAGDLTAALDEVKRLRARIAKAAEWLDGDPIDTDDLIEWNAAALRVLTGEASDVG